MLTIFGETKRLDALLQHAGPRPTTLVCQGNVFQTSIKYGGKSYITGLFDQEVPCSTQIKTEDTSFDHLVVWSDWFGVTKVEFVHSNFAAAAYKPENPQVTDTHSFMKQAPVECRNCVQLGRKHRTAIQPEREWVYTVAVTGPQVHLEYKRHFVRRIVSSLNNLPQTFWDCSNAPILQPQDTEILRDDVFLGYVPLQNISGIILTFDLGSVKTIWSYEGTHPRPSFDSKADSQARSTLFSLADDEKIQGIWTVRHNIRTMYVGVRAMVLKTQMKTVWLGGYMSLEMQPDFELELIADGSILALYYGSLRRINLTLAAHQYPHEASLKRVLAPTFQAYRTAPPPISTSAYDMKYSEAHTEGVEKLWACMDGDYCIGLLFSYGSYSRTVGQYRYEKEMSPAYKLQDISLLQEEHESGPRTRLQVIGGGLSRSVTEGTTILLTPGIIVWWYCQDASAVYNVTT
ncbi:hypothetical protein OPT61_g2606 [Boeremia exigua]|uniref:Uncharacterized protein n=1 Tax=Boeremia exigua TaxID=749465 RepID=A0ACC2IL54_9PLEO|nr:hypothetical protein OPT61_g2606 [Boeremia exigua]